jgi:hypothetical protein
MMSALDFANVCSAHDLIVTAGLRLLPVAKSPAAVKSSSREEARPVSGRTSAEEFAELKWSALCIARTLPAESKRNQHQQIAHLSGRYSET